MALLWNHDILQTVKQTSAGETLAWDEGNRCCIYHTIGCCFHVLFLVQVYPFIAIVFALSQDGIQSEDFITNYSSLLALTRVRLKFGWNFTNR